MESKLNDKAWTKEFEKSISGEFLKNPFKFDKKSLKPVYSIDTPPPYVNTPIHMGHAATYSLMDMFARFRRMIGFNVLFPLGLDRNGLPIEMAAEKKFGKKFNEVSREEFLKMCEKVLQESSTESVDSFQKLAISFNSWNLGTGIGDLYHTDSDDYRALTQETFIDLYNKGLIYEDERINNYCPGCRTTLADAEVIYETKPTLFNDVIFKVKETGEEIIIGTTRPELICTCGMVIFNPDDERYQHLAGKTAITPVFEKEVPIKAHPMAEIEKGTGLAMMCSAGDLSDIRFFREMNLVPTIAINADGKMNENAGFLEGMKVREARKKIIETLRENGLLVKQTQINHRTPICERSKDEIEFIAMNEFYLKQIEFKDKMLEIAEMINFYAPESKQIYLDWVNSISIDWPISRRRYYATEVPVWHCECGELILPPKGKYYKPWKEPAPVKKCPKCGSGKIKGDERVFDTWFDSSISPLYILKYSRDLEFFEKNSRCSLRPQGKEIVRTWLYYTLFKDYLLTGKAIFRDVWINYHILDDKGKKMSKSAGNSIDPQKIIEKFGAEPLRLWCAVEGNLDRTDFRCSEERIDGAGKTLTKLWNVSKFILMFPEPNGKIELTALDKWIINEINSIVKNARIKFEKYDFHNPIIELKNFLWEIFASHYLELVKGRAYNDNNKFSKEEQNAAVFTLTHCLEKMLKVFAPVIPMITYKIYSEFRGKDIHLEEFPKADEEYELEFKKEELLELNSLIWKTKKDAGKSLKAEVTLLMMPEKFKSIEADLKEAHSIKEIKYGELGVKI
jgi:valyl-tRNA synthetase